MSQSRETWMDKLLFPVFLTNNSTNFSKFVTVNKMKIPHNVGCHPIPALDVSLLWENREVYKSLQLLHNTFKLLSVFV
jgi:hypothetical protein